MTKKQLMMWGKRLAELIDTQSTASDKIDAMLIEAGATNIRGKVRPIVVSALVALGWSQATAYRKVKAVLGEVYNKTGAPGKTPRKSAAKPTATPAEIVENKPKLSKVARRIEVMMRGLRKPDREALLAYLAS
jgi:hypothetical protein